MKTKDLNNKETTPDIMGRQHKKEEEDYKQKSCPNNDIFFLKIAKISGLKNYFFIYRVTYHKYCLKGV